MISAEIIIIGAGFAGASTAYHLARSGVRDLLILEQGEVAGGYASTRNAGMVRQLVSHEILLPFLKEGADFIRQLPADWLTPIDFRQHGSLLLGQGAMWKKLRADMEKAQKQGIRVDELAREEACEKVAILRDSDFEGAVWCPTDGVVDIHALLRGYLTLAMKGGARLMTSSKVLGIRKEKDRITSVVTHSEVIQTKVVINAAGAWAAEIGRMAGAVPVPLRSYRRHLFVTDPLPWVDSQWPFVWDLSDELYFRPEAGGLLLSPCDETEHPPGLPSTDPDAMQLLHRKLKRFPALYGLPIKSVWAGLRTFAPDRQFVIGRDPIISNFFWVAGLGGHGVTASGFIGRFIADLITKPETEEIEYVSPARFIRE